MNSPETLGLQADTCGQILHALETAQSWLQHAYCLSRAGYFQEEAWAVALADSLHHCQESLEKLAQDHAEL